MSIIGDTRDDFHVEATRNEDETMVILECWRRGDDSWTATKEDKVKLSISDDKDEHDKNVRTAAEHLIAAARHRAEAGGGAA
jgi:hypothetical protein